MDSSDNEELVWVPDDNVVCAIAKIIRNNVYMNDKENIQVELVDSKKKSLLLRSTCFPVDTSHLQNLDDILLINSMHEFPVIDLLRRRWLSLLNYTFAGEILISINPYQRILGHDENPMRYFNLDGSTFHENVPHVYAIANKAYKEIIQPITANEICSQSIVVTGESGAGKTEAFKLMINFLTECSCKMFKGSSAEVIKRVIIDSNVLFEAFGNAKTARNDNSSRFGKYVRLYYSTDGLLKGAHSEVFLLEKSRLLVVGEGDHNFHIFYQLLYCLDSADKEKLRLTKIDDFKMLTEGGCLELGNEQSIIASFGDVCHAFDRIRVKDIFQLWSLLACLMHLRNVEVLNVLDGQPAMLIYPTMPVSEISDLLGVTPEDLQTALTVQSVTIRNETFKKSLSEEDTRNNLYALIKGIYSAIFNWMVVQVNKLNPISESHTETFVGILDIFGFEIFLKQNSFEQLCINYANERLQQLFNETTFRTEQQVYVSEGLDHRVVTFTDNQPVIDLIGKKPLGLLFLLEEHGIMNRDPDDLALLATFNKQYAGSHKSYVKPRIGVGSFTIRHFACDVSYTASGFLTKNNDALQGDLATLMAASQNSFLIEALRIDTEATAVATQLATESGAGRLTSAPSPSGLRAASGRVDCIPNRTSVTGRKLAAGVTVSYKFRGQLDGLIRTLRATRTFFVKCIKPNHTKSSTDFNAQLVLAQLKYSGVLEVVRIRREGYPTRLLYKDFLRSYADLTRMKAWMPLDQVDDSAAKETCSLICTEYLPEGSFKLGHTFLFLQKTCPQVMHDAVQKRRDQFLSRIQSNFRRFVAQKRFNNVKAAAIVVQRVARMRFAVSLLLNLREARHDLISKKATLLQAAVRGFQCRKFVSHIRKVYYSAQSVIFTCVKMWLEKTRYNNFRAQIINVQRNARRMLCRRHWKRGKVSACLIQTSWRSSWTRRQYNRQRKGFIRFQALYKRHICNFRYKSLLKAVILIQSVHRGYLAQGQFIRARGACILLQSFARGFIAWRNYQHVREAVVLLQSYFRLLLQKIEIRKQNASAVKLQRWFNRTMTQIRDRRIVAQLHDLCRNVNERPDGIQILNEMMWCLADDNLVHVRDRRYDFCTAFHSAACGRQRELLQDLGAQDILDRDIYDRRLLHYLARAPNYTTITNVSATIESLRPRFRLQLELAEEEELLDEEEKDEAASKVELPHVRTSALGLPTLMSGWLRKKSSILGITTWLKRWCVLTDETLELYKTNKSKKVSGLLDMEGCSVYRAPDNSPILVISKPKPLGHVESQRSLFRSEKVREESYTLRAESELVLQEWLRPLMSAAGVTPFREDPPVNYLNVELRARWVSMIDKFGRTALHYLAGADLPRAPEQDQALMSAAWLIESGCDPRVVDNRGETAYAIATQCGNDQIATFLLSRIALLDCPEKKLLPPPVYSKGYSYVQIHVGRLRVKDPVQNSLLNLDHPRLIISVVTNEKAVVEGDQVLHPPAALSARTAWWGVTWHMQTPLENLSQDVLIVFRLLHGAQSKPLVKYTQVLYIERATINSGPVEIAFVHPTMLSDGVRGLHRMDSNTSRRKIDVSQHQKAGHSECDLFGELSLTKRFRQIDLHDIYVHGAEVSVVSNTAK